MQTVEELLLDEETLIGRYNMEIARWSDHKWSPTMPSLDVLLTDHRLIMQTQSRKRREPAFIPCHTIKKVTTVEDDYHRLIAIIQLKTGHHINLFVGRGGMPFVRALRRTGLPQSPVKFENDLNLGYLQKIIQHVEQL